MNAQAKLLTACAITAALVAVGVNAAARVGVHWFEHKSNWYRANFVEPPHSVPDKVYGQASRMPWPAPTDHPLEKADQMLRDDPPESIPYALMDAKGRYVRGIHCVRETLECR